MPINRRELIKKLDKLIAAENESQPPFISTIQEVEAEDFSAEGLEDTRAQFQPPGPLDIASEGS